MNNTTCAAADDLEWLVLKRTLYGTVIPALVLFCFVTIASNCIVLAAAGRIAPSKWTPTLTLTMSLAGSDMWLCAILGVGFIHNSYLPVVHGIHWIHHACGSFVIEALRLGSVTTSVLHLSALAISQLRSCSSGQLRRCLIASRASWRLRFVVLIVWVLPPTLFSILFSSVPNEGFRAGCAIGPAFSGLSFRVSVAVVLVLPLPGMAIAYVRTIRQVQKKRLRIRGKRTRRRADKLLSTIVTTLVITFSFIILMSPSLLLYVFICRNCIMSICDADPLLVFVASITVNSLLILKSFVNPFLYAARIPDVRNAIRVCVHLPASAVPTEYTQSEFSEMRTSQRSSVRRPRSRASARVQSHC